jgi:polyisoprenyl-teichoic acid--peptidoglycan teichoic acid transferase
MVEGGNLVRVPELYETYRSSIDSNLTLDGLLEAVPLALKLGDPSRVGYFHLSPAASQLWQISDQPEASVFLPNRPAVMRFMQQAIDFVTTPSPLSEVVITLEYELTVSPTPTSTATADLDPTQTFTPRPTMDAYAERPYTRGEE